jgi:phage shock protein PspC (stress-responsive transcriptional regulator)
MNTTDANSAPRSETPTDPTGQSAPGPSGAGHAYSDLPGTAPSQPLYRPFDGRMLGGVAEGIARYMDLDVTIVRIILAVLAFVGGAGIPLYLAGWLLIPEEGARRSLAAEFLDSIQNRAHQA